MTNNIPFTRAELAATVTAHHPYLQEYASYTDVPRSIERADGLCDRGTHVWYLCFGTAEHPDMLSVVASTCCVSVWYRNTLNPDEYTYDWTWYWDSDHDETDLAIVLEAIALTVVASPYLTLVRQEYEARSRYEQLAAAIAARLADLGIAAPADPHKALDLLVTDLLLRPDGGALDALANDFAQHV